MRTKMLSLAVLALAFSTAQADPPARLGLPLGSGEAASPPALGFPISPSSTAGETLVPGRPPVFTVPEVSLAPALDSEPTPSGPQKFSMPTTAGYPSAFPPPSSQGALPMGGRVLPPGALPPGASFVPGGLPGGLTPVRGNLGNSVTLPAELRQKTYATGPCGSLCDPSQGCKEFSDNPFTDNLALFFGLDGAHEPIDLGINGRFGYRLHINWGLPLVEDFRLGLHLGAGYNYGNNTGRLLNTLGVSRDMQQTFFTVGLFQRTELGLNWEVAWDFRSDDYYDNFNTSQWRGLLSVDVGQRDEIGFWGTYRDRTDRTFIGAAPFSVRPINQINLFWRHTWDMQVTTGFWAGIAEEHGRFVLVTPGASAVQHPFVFGGDLFVPLSDRLAIYGEAQFITPNDSGTVVATLGLAWYPSGRPSSQPRGTFSPLLPAASNANFSLDLQQ